MRCNSVHSKIFHVFAYEDANGCYHTTDLNAAVVNQGQTFKFFPLKLLSRHIAALHLASSQMLNIFRMRYIIYRNKSKSRWWFEEIWRSTVWLQCRIIRRWSQQSSCVTKTFVGYSDQHQFDGERLTHIHSKVCRSKYVQQAWLFLWCDSKQ